jgi:Holliday junction resolvase RusA-like endonuclease
MQFTFTVHGKPATQGSKTYLGRGRAIESNKRLAPWRSDIAAACALARPAGWPTAGPMQATMVFRFARPQSHFRTNGELKPTAPQWHLVIAGDVDKLSRAANDAITASGTWGDDKQLVRMVVERHWCAPGELPGATITLLALDPAG